MRYAVSLVLVLGFLAGCGPIVQSVPVTSANTTPEGEGGTTQVGGLVYFLPKSMLHIVNKPMATTKTATTQAVSNAASNKASAKAGNNKSAAAAGNAATASNKEAAAGDAAKQETAVSATHDIEFVYYNSSINKQCMFTIDVVTVPDPKKLFYLRMVPSPMSYDTMTVTVKDGFLSSVNTETKDESGEIAKKSVELVKQAVLLGAGVPGSAATAGLAAKGGALVAGNLDLMIDPDLLIDLQKKNSLCILLPKEISITLLPLAEVKGTPEPQSKNGVYYRAAFPYDLQVSVMENDEGTNGGQANSAGSLSNSGATPCPSFGGKLTTTIKRIVMMPNASPTFIFDMKRAAFVKNTYDLKFENGFLTSANFTKPSEALAGISLPIDIIKGIASIPTEIIQLKFNYNSKQEALLEQQKTRFETLQAFNQSILAMYQENATNTQAIIDKLNSMKQ